MKGMKLYTIPNSRAPSPSGRSAKSKSATVASVLTRMFTHMGRMKSITMVLAYFILVCVRIYAAG